ncbi:MAG: hypothetical protein NZ580_07305 [Bacteroidia bacterium]|nr:hypothetical protein [Bacteroidia bacterium]MDW8236633.1 hypothetical protein [Bacteroidia bacterium]
MRAYLFLIVLLQAQTPENTPVPFTLADQYRLIRLEARIEALEKQIEGLERQIEAL